APGETINVASGRSVSLIELIDVLKQVTGTQHLAIDHQAPRAGDLRESSADISKARALLGYEPRIQLAEGLSGVVEYFRAATQRAAWVQTPSTPSTPSFVFKKKHFSACSACSAFDPKPLQRTQSGDQ